MFFISLLQNQTVLMVRAIRIHNVFFYVHEFQCKSLSQQVVGSFGVLLASHIDGGWFVLREDLSEVLNGSISKNGAIVLLSIHYGRIDDGDFLDDSSQYSLSVNPSRFLMELEIVGEKHANMSAIGPIVHWSDLFGICYVPIRAASRTLSIQRPSYSSFNIDNQLYVVSNWSIQADVVILAEIDESFLIVGYI